jgi:hypothetical protein
MDRLRVEAIREREIPNILRTLNLRFAVERSFENVPRGRFIIGPRNMKEMED